MSKDKRGTKKIITPGRPDDDCMVPCWEGKPVLRYGLNPQTKAMGWTLDFRGLSNMLSTFIDTIHKHQGRIEELERALIGKENTEKDLTGN